MVKFFLTKITQFQKIGSKGNFFFRWEIWKIKSTFEAGSRSRFSWPLHFCCSMEFFSSFQRENDLHFKKIHKSNGEKVFKNHHNSLHSLAFKNSYSAQQCATHDVKWSPNFTESIDQSISRSVAHMILLWCSFWLRPYMNSTILTVTWSPQANSYEDEKTTIIRLLTDNLDSGTDNLERVSFIYLLFKVFLQTGMEMIF